jgi:hypothetical protein
VSSPGPKAQFRQTVDDINDRERMEASENVGTSHQRYGRPSLHRIDRDRVTHLVREGMGSPGFDRLHLMVGTIIPRLEEPRRR